MWLHRFSSRGKTKIHPVEVETIQEEREFDKSFYCVDGISTLVFVCFECCSKKNKKEQEIVML